MKKDHILFIGGPLDGKRQKVPNSPYPGTHIQTHTGFDQCRDVPSYERVLATPLKIETYKLSPVRCGGGEIMQVAVHSSVGDFMKKLISGYHYARSKRRW